MGGGPSKPLSATFERADRTSNIQVSEDLVRHLVEAQAPRHQSQPSTPVGDIRAERVLAVEQELDSQRENIERLLAIAYAEGEKRGRENAEKAIEEKQSTVTIQILEREIGALGQREVNHVKDFDEFAKGISARFRVPEIKARRCSEAEVTVLQCYINNPQRPLDCADEVRQFTECAEGQAKAFLVSQGGGAANS